MNLHRSDNIADWEKFDIEKLNIFQKVASKTRGVITPGNILSITGGLMVVSGLVDIYSGDKERRGIWKVGVGRLIDVIDGVVADKTGTKSPLGEAVDASVDKLAMAGIVGVFVRREIITKQTAKHILAQNISNIAITGLARSTGADLHPSSSGKQAMLLQGMTLGFSGMARVSEEGEIYTEQISLD
jgi:phosphatidylglycerophosphate synthase